jgi:predicted flap endonuclease-1-like 5' DNA nuclease
VKVSDRYLGDADPFEGDRTLTLGILPEGARVTKATVIVEPALTAKTAGFEEEFSFDAQARTLNAADWGIARSPDSPAAAVEIEFHATRTLVALTGSQTVGMIVPGTTTNGVTVAVGLGSAYIGLADDGTFMDPNKKPLPVTFPTTTPPRVSVPSISASRVKVFGKPAASTDALTLSALAIRTTASNVSVRLGKTAPFWTRPGPLVGAAVSPDFAEVLNIFLATATIEDGFYRVPMTLHTDTIARLNLEVQLEYVIQHAVLPAHLKDATFRYAFSTLPDQPPDLTTVRLPADAVPVSGSTGAAIRGTMQPSRVAQGPVGEVAPVTAVVVAADSTLAQPMGSPTELAITAVDVPLGNTAPGLAGLNVAIRGDLDGKPSSNVLASASLRVDKALPGESSWGSATLAAPFRALAGTRYWLVVQSLNGPAQWMAGPGSASEPPLQRSHDNGFSWRAASNPGAPPPLAGLFRLRNVPNSFTVPVQLQIGNGAAAQRRRLDEYAPLARIEFAFDFAATLQEYLAHPQLAVPCTGPEAVVNPAFDQPPPDDATRTLFGVDAAKSGYRMAIQSVDLSQGVDLSRERVITLTVDGTGPLRIDCAGRRPSATTIDEIADAINRAASQSVASVSKSSRIELISGGGSGFVWLNPWSRRQLPAGWQAPADEVCQVMVPDGGGRTQLVLASPSVLAKVAGFCPEIKVALESRGASTTAAQRVAVVAGCAYLLDVDFQFGTDPPTTPDWPPWPPAYKSAAAAPSRWEIDWLDANNAVLSTDAGSLAPPVGGVRVRVTAPTEQRAQLRLVAPTAGVAAELRITNGDPRTYALILGHVSLMPTRSLMSNGAFGQWETVDIRSVPARWSTSGGRVVQITDGQQIVGVGLLGDGPGDTVLAQRVDIVPGQRYELRARALAVKLAGASTSALVGRPRIEIGWTGSPMPTATTVPLDGPGFLRKAWAGDVPAGVTSAEIRVIQPKGPGALLVEAISLERVDLASIPLMFLSEAPGELTVRDLAVTYDRPVLEAPSTWDAAVEKLLEGPRGEIQPVVVPPPRAASPPAPSLSDIAGIGEARARRLAGAGISSVEALAAADPGYVASLFRGVSVEVARQMVDRASQKLAESSADQENQP